MSQKILGDKDYGLISKILNLPDPTNLQDAATKNYVDNLIQRKRGVTRLTNNSNTTLINISELAFPVLANVAYTFEAWILFQSATVTTTGLALTLAGPAGFYNLRARMAAAADGTASDYIGSILTTGDIVTAANSAATATTLLAKIEGIIIPTANGTVTPQFRSETNLVQVSIEAGSLARMIIHP